MMTDKRDRRRDNQVGPPDEESVIHTYRVQPDESLSEAVLTAIADALDTAGDPLLTTESPLYDVIDIEAVDQVFGSESATEPRGQISFTYEGHTVTVTSEDEIFISE